MWWVFLTVKHRIEQRLKALDLPPGTTHWTSCTLQEAGITTNRKKKKKTRYTHWRNHPLGLCGSLQDRLYWTKKAECTYLHFRKWLPAQLCAMKRRRDCWLRKKNKCTAKITRVVALAMQWQRKHFGWVSQQSCGHGKENLLCTSVHWNATSTINPVWLLQQQVQQNKLLPTHCKYQESSVLPGLSEECPLLQVERAFIVYLFHRC